MPCYDGRDSVSYARNEARSEARAEAFREFRHNSPVAEMLCEAMQIIEANGLPVSVNLANWWVEHKIRDSRR